MSLATTYYLSVVLASIGVMQIVGASNQFKGLLFVPNYALAKSIGCIFVISGFALLFGSGPQHLPDTSGGLDGNSQAAFFTLGALTGVTTTLLISSLVNITRLPSPTSTKTGLDMLKHTTYLKAMSWSLKIAWKRLRS